MIDLYTSNSPNGVKASIALEELGLPYTVHHLRLDDDEGQTAAYRAISPIGKIPAIVDRDTGATVFESAAVLLYLADKTDRLLPRDAAARAEALSWLMLHAGTIGPTIGQFIAFAAADHCDALAIGRLRGTLDRFLSALEQRLSRRDFLASGYSIADIAHFGWIHALAEWSYPLGGWPALLRWRDRVLARPAVQRGLSVPSPLETITLRWLEP